MVHAVADARRSPEDEEVAFVSDGPLLNLAGRSRTLRASDCWLGSPLSG